MSKSPPDEGASRAELWFRAEGREDAQVLIALTALGMCRALSAGAISPAYACHRLFGPALLAELEQMGAHPELRDAIHLATELEDVADIIPDKLSNSIAEVETRLMKVLRVLPSNELAGEKWLAWPDAERVGHRADRYRQ
ncbi:DUF3969 family protein [Archangium violaceum]|uniref:DUF3969 family protein n=1 Tax=Archangium violaceum TaxID=83451 RepID=UPI001951E9FF|nr:DUF3969 family protein [Archangium violaceum]QRN99444.1 DUF3969 family protein [Archangium violaceum]